MLRGKSVALNAKKKILQNNKVKVVQLCLSIVRGFLQVRILEWVAVPSPGDLLNPGIGYPLQYSGLQNSMDCIVHGFAESWT